MRPGIDPPSRMEVKQCQECRDTKNYPEHFKKRKRDANALAICTSCWPEYNRRMCLAARRKRKELLVAEHGGKCLDCGESYPPYVMDFDHRDPATKDGRLGNFIPQASIAKARAEAAKCDLVCANCHRERTHKQRCSGCTYCNELGLALLSHTK